MNKPILLITLFVVTISASVVLADNGEESDYFVPQREMIRNGVQAVLMCNGLFTSDRSLQQVFKQELAYIRGRLGTTEGIDYSVDKAIRSVSVGGGKNGIEITAAYRKGVGCVVMSPDQSLEDVSSLPELMIKEPSFNPASTPWPLGDVLSEPIDEDLFDQKALQAASDWAFNRDTEEQDTISLLIVHKGRIVHERYADGFDMHTKTRTWSTAKSIAASIVGLLVDDGRLELDSSLDINWLPEKINPESDPRKAISLRHLLNMTSGLYPVDSYGMEYATGSGLSYWAGSSASVGARKRALIREPGELWEYENYDTILAVLAMKKELGTAYHQFGYKELLHKIGMRNTVMGMDRFGDFILSSQVYSNARDLARLGLLYLQNGVWDGEQLISQEWIDFIRTPAPASSVRGSDYGGHWWLVPDTLDDVPSDAYSTSGNRGQFVIVLPSHDLVIVRRGLDFGRQGFSRWKLTKEILEAFTDKQ